MFRQIRLISHLLLLTASSVQAKTPALTTPPDAGGRPSIVIASKLAGEPRAVLPTGSISSVNLGPDMPSAGALALKPASPLPGRPQVKADQIAEPAVNLPDRAAPLGPTA